ncbi:hypothetical protein BD414DRAFT_110287 [Trametes punicea]|nr:hypothetical protein BD414DRAFT_110287 [Trametes punicea]
MSSTESASVWWLLVQKKLVAFSLIALPWTANIFCNACLVVTIQSFYAFRIMTLNKSLTLTVMLASFILADFALASTLFVKSIMIETFSDASKLQPFDVALSIMTATTDALLSATLVTLLVRSRTGSPVSDRLINKLLFYTINTGLLTSLCAILSLITVLVSPTTSIYVMFYYIGAHLYSVSLLGSLNARTGLRAQAEERSRTTAVSQLADLLQRLSPRLRSVQPSHIWDCPTTPPMTIVVSIQRDTIITVDDDDGDTVHKLEGDAAYLRTTATRSSRFLDVDGEVANMCGQQASDPWMELTRLTPSPDLTS